MKSEGRIDGFGRADQAEKGSHCKYQRQAALADGHGFGTRGLAHADSLLRTRLKQSQSREKRFDRDQDD
jgi:hypothetical protein